MKLIFERGSGGQAAAPGYLRRALPGRFRRHFRPQAEGWICPEVSETELSRHYSALAKQVYGVNNGFYPLGSCTMKYNPAGQRGDRGAAGLPEIHPLQG